MRPYPLIFIVEDNQAFNKLIEQHLRKNNFQNVKSFTTGEDCLKQLYLKPDIIIQDYMLQGISGLSVLQRTKKILPDCEFIFLSVKDNIDIALNTIKYGAFDYIVKNDFAFQRLIQKIENIIQIQSLKRNNRQLILLSILLLACLLTIGLIIYIFRFHRM